jgi:O-antigen ligase
VNQPQISLGHGRQVSDHIVDRAQPRRRSVAFQHTSGSVTAEPTRYDLLRVVLFVLTLTTLSRLHEAFPLFRQTRPALVLFVVAVLAGALQIHKLGWESALRWWPTRAVLALFLLAAIGSPFGMSLGGSASFVLQNYSKVIVFGLLLMLTIRGASDLRLYIWAFVLACGVLNYLAIFVFDLSSGMDNMVRRLSNLYTYDANDLGCVLMVGLPLSVLMFQTSRWRGRVVSGLVIVGMGVAVARSGSRGAFLGLIATGLALLLLARGMSLVRRAGILVAVLATLSVAAPAGYWDQMRTLQDPKSDYNWNERDGRRQVAQRGIRYMLDNPVFGLGINNFGRAEGTISGKNDDNPNRGMRWVAAHNSFVQVGAEMGFPGLLLFSGIVLGGIAGMLRLRRRLQSAGRTATEDERFTYLASTYLPASLVGFAVTAFFVSFAYMDLIYVVAAFMTGTYQSAWALQQRPRQSVAESGRRARLPLRRGGGWAHGDVATGWAQTTRSS